MKFIFPFGILDAYCIIIKTVCFAACVRVHFFLFVFGEINVVMALDEGLMIGRIAKYKLSILSRFILLKCLFFS